MLYLIKSYGVGGRSILKIGYTDNMENRMSRYFYSNPLFEIISTREGDEILEKLLHYYLYYLGYRFQKNGKLDEWFLDSPEVRKVFHITQESLEARIWRLRSRVFDIAKVGSHVSNDNKLFEYLYEKNKESFCGEEFEVCGKRIRKLKTPKIDIEFKKFLVKNSDIESSGNLVVKEFLDNHFYSTGNFEKRMRLYCEFRDLYKDNPEIINDLSFKIPDQKYHLYYEYYGTSGCRAFKYQEAELRRGWNDAAQEDKLIIEVKSTFKPGDRLTLKDIKEKLTQIYKTLGISKTAKAKDLENYFTVSRTRITTVDRGVTEGYKITGIL